MAFMDFVETVEHNLDRKTEPAGLGTGQAQKKKTLADIAVRYFVADMEDPGAKDEVERIFTRALRCENMMDKPGDVSVFKEESHFDKSGRYLVAIKYGEYIDPDAELLSEDKPVEPVEDFDV